MMELINKFTTTSSGTIVISSIPQTYSSLRIFANGKPDQDLGMVFNSNSETRSREFLRMSGSTVTLRQVTSSHPLIAQDDVSANPSATYRLDLRVSGYSDTTKRTCIMAGAWSMGTDRQYGGITGDFFASNTAVTSITLPEIWSIGTKVQVYGVL